MWQPCRPGSGRGHGNGDDAPREVLQVREYSSSQLPDGFQCVSRADPAVEEAMETVTMLHERFLPEAVAPLEYLGPLCSSAALLPHTQARISILPTPTLPPFYRAVLRKYHLLAPLEYLDNTCSSAAILPHTQV